MELYTCPMHPEIVSDKPGKCPKCGMALVLKSEIKPKMYKPTSDRGLGMLSWKNYMPLIVIIVLIFLASIITAFSNNQFFLQAFILHFMTGFFLVFAGFKLMDLKGFAEGYSIYDILASRLEPYGYIYPFIELIFGLLMLAGYHPTGLLWVEFIVMAFSGIGVTIKLAKGEEFQCACLGTFLKVPLTYVTLIEDFGMALLALVLVFLT
jgi:hypothetical protein